MIWFEKIILQCVIFVCDAVERRCAKHIDKQWDELFDRHRSKETTFRFVVDEKGVFNVKKISDPEETIKA